MELVAHLLLWYFTSFLQSYTVNQASVICVKGPFKSTSSEILRD